MYYEFRTCSFSDENVQFCKLVRNFAKISHFSCLFHICEGTSIKFYKTFSSPNFGEIFLLYSMKILSKFTIFKFLRFKRQFREKRKRKHSFYLIS